MGMKDVTTLAEPLLDDSEILEWLRPDSAHGDSLMPDWRGRLEVMPPTPDAASAPQRAAA
jgi:hypothetical protein